MKNFRMYYIFVFSIFIFSILTFIYYKQTRELAITNATANIHEFLVNYKSYRAYISKEQKQEIFRLQSLGHIDVEYFRPQILSSTYSARSVNKIYNKYREQKGLKPIEIKFASTNPRNPKNKATQKEAMLLEKFNAHELDEYSEILQTANGTTLYYAIPTEKTKNECMRCHSRPEAAPKDLIALYGDKNGFFEKVGEIRALIVTKYPLDPDLKAANQTFMLLTISTLLVIVIILIIVYMFLKKVKQQEIYRFKNEQRLEKIVALSKKAANLTEKEVCDEALDIAVDITDSKIGYLHTFNDDQNEISFVSWNKETLKNCSAMHDTHYPLQSAGIWADAVRLKKVVVHNDYAKTQHKTQLPMGLFEIIRHMGAPVLDGEMVTMIIGVGNKETLYTKMDEQLLQATANDVEKLILKKRAEQKILEQKEEFETIFKSTRDGIAIIDLDTKFLNCNDAFAQITGYSQDELLTKSCKELTLEEDREKNDNAIQYAIEHEYIENIEKHCTSKTGKVFSVNMSISLLPDKKRLLLVIKDITQLKLFESQSKLASMGEMIGNIAHQWRQPLSVISASATGIKLHKELGIITDDYLLNTCNSINDNAQYLSETINDFRDFIKGERKIKEFDLKENIHSFIHLIEDTLKDHDIHLVLDLEDDISIQSYPNELLQCFINIFNNSKDVFEERNITDKLFFITTQKQKDSVTISFKDNGNGISQIALIKLFEPYFTTKHQSKGTGLGLSMVYNMIVDGMDGNIEANNVSYEYENKHYKGAEFIITLPL